MKIIMEDLNELGLETADQKISSAATSINSNKLPAIYKLVDFEPGSVNLDFGGGKFDNAINFVKDKGATLVVYDPYNRSQQHNKEALEIIRSNKGADNIVNSNVLNVIAEPESRLAVIKNIYNLLKTGGNAYFTVYEGDKSGEGRETKAGYQLNRATNDYLEEIQKVFPNAKRKGKLIIATK